MKTPCAVLREGLVSAKGFFFSLWSCITDNNELVNRHATSRRPPRCSIRNGRRFDRPCMFSFPVLGRLLRLAVWCAWLSALSFILIFRPPRWEHDIPSTPLDHLHLQVTRLLWAKSGSLWLNVLAARIRWDAPQDLGLRSQRLYATSQQEIAFKDATVTTNTTFERQLLSREGWRCHWFSLDVTIIKGDDGALRP